jgi:hypothetical protein
MAESRILKPGMDRAITASTEAAEREIEASYVIPARRAHEASVADTQRSLAERHAAERAGAAVTAADAARESRPQTARPRGEQKAP